MQTKYLRQQQSNYLTLCLELCISKDAPTFIKNFFSQVTKKNPTKAVDQALISFFTDTLSPEELLGLANMLNSEQEVEGTENKTSYNLQPQGYQFKCLKHIRKGNTLHLFTFLDFIRDYLLSFDIDQNKYEPTVNGEYFVGIVIAGYEHKVSAIAFSKEAERFLLKEIGPCYMTVSRSDAGLRTTSYPLHEDYTKANYHIKFIQKVFEDIEKSIVEEEQKEIELKRQEDEQKRQEISKIFDKGSHVIEFEDVEMREMKEDSVLTTIPVSETVSNEAILDSITYVSESINEVRNESIDVIIEKLNKSDSNWITYLLYLTYSGHMFGNDTKRDEIANMLIENGYLCKAYHDREIRAMVTEKGTTLIKEGILRNIKDLHNRLTSYDLNDISTLLCINKTLVEFNKYLDNIEENGIKEN